MVFVCWKSIVDGSEENWKKGLREGKKERGDIGVLLCVVWGSVGEERESELQ